MWVNCLVPRLNSNHFDQAGGLSLREQRRWRRSEAVVKVTRFNCPSFSRKNFQSHDWPLQCCKHEIWKKPTTTKTAMFPRHGFHLVAEAATSLVQSVLVLIVCTTSEPFISFTYFSQNHPYEYAKGKLCETLFPLEKNCLQLNKKKNNPFDLHLVLNNMKPF